MTILNVFVTFGLPAIALAGALWMLRVQTRATDRLREGLDRDEP